MILIVEGTDGVGKTAFARWYANQLGATYLHAGPPSSADPWEEYLDTLEIGRDYVLDRWHLGEIVWPHLFGRQSLFWNDWATWTALNSALNARGAHLLVVWRENDEIRKTLLERGEDEEAIQRSIEGQRALLDSCRLVDPLQVSVVHSDVLHSLVTKEVNTW